MKTQRYLPRTLVTALLVVSVIAASAALAQERRDGRERERPRERFQTPHMVFDDRFHHNHYYPTLGYAYPALPGGYLTVPFRGNPFFFHAGVWYQRTAPGYVVVRPPFGIAIPVLPFGYATVWAGGQPYYYANDVYYAQGPGGYVVVDPPMNMERGRNDTDGQL